MAKERHGEFLKLYMAALPSLRAYVISVVRNLSLVEDALQETALAAWKQFDGYDPKRPFIGWALRIARNKAVDALRARGRRQLLPDEVLEKLATTTPDAADENAVRRAALDRCLEKLGEGARGLVRMRFNERLSAEDISERIGKSLAAVRKALTRARAFLVDCTGKALQEGAA